MLMRPVHCNYNAHTHTHTHERRDTDLSLSRSPSPARGERTSPLLRMTQINEQTLLIWDIILVKLKSNQEHLFWLLKRAEGSCWRVKKGGGGGTERWSNICFVSLSRSVHVPKSDISTSTWWIATKFCTNIHGSQTVCPKDFICVCVWNISTNGRNFVPMSLSGWTALTSMNITFHLTLSSCWEFNVGGWLTRGLCCVSCQLRTSLQSHRWVQTERYFMLQVYVTFSMSLLSHWCALVTFTHRNHLVWLRKISWCERRLIRISGENVNRGRICGLEKHLLLTLYPGDWAARPIACWEYLINFSMLASQLCWW